MADQAIPTSNVWPNYSPLNRYAASGATPGSLGKDEFLKILVAQLRSQNPLEPMGDKEFIAQMAQFSALEQMMNMAEAMNRLSGSLGLYSSMIGKTIGWYAVKDDGTIEVETGLVEAIVVRDGKLYAVSGRREIPVEDIVSIGPADSPEPDDGDDGKGEGEGEGEAS